MSPRRTRLKIPGMCADGPPSCSEAEMTDRHRLRWEVALAQVSQDATYCVPYSSIREILNSQDLVDRIARETQQAIVAELDEEQAAVDHPQRLATKMEKRIQDTIARVWEG